MFEDSISCFLSSGMADWVLFNGLFEMNCVFISKGLLLSYSFCIFSSSGDLRVGPEYFQITFISHAQLWVLMDCNYGFRKQKRIFILIFLLLHCNLFPFLEQKIQADISSNTMQEAKKKKKKQRFMFFCCQQLHHDFCI